MKLLALFVLLAITPTTKTKPKPELQRRNISLDWTLPDDQTIKGVKLCFGQKSGQQTQCFDVGYTEHYAHNVNAKFHFVVAKSYNFAGLESLPSNEVFF